MVPALKTAGVVGIISHVDLKGGKSEAHSQPLSENKTPTSCHNYVHSKTRIRNEEISTVGTLRLEPHRRWVDIMLQDWYGI
jgi:hypothetical protein